MAQQRVGYGFDVPRKRGESIFTTSWDPCNMYIPDRCLAQVKSCVVAKSTALLTTEHLNADSIPSSVVMSNLEQKTVSPALCSVCRVFWPFHVWIP